MRKVFHVEHFRNVIRDEVGRYAVKMRKLFVTFVVAGVVASAAGAGPREDVAAMLKDLERAVLAADVKGVMDRISGDACFTTEWRHWAEQLDKYKPAEFSLALGTGGVEEEGRVEAPLVMMWKITTGPEDSWGAGGKERKVKWPTVVFAKEDPDGAGPLPSRWVFKGEKWERLEGERFGVCYLPGSEEVAKLVARTFPVARDHDEEGFGVKGPPQVIKLYTSMDHLKASVYLNMPDTILGGWNEPGESIKFMASYTSGERGWTNAFAHEYGHACTWELGKVKPNVWWLEEGVAELAAMAYRPGYWERLDREMHLAAKTGTLTPWDEISDYITAKPPVKQRAYTQGSHMVAYVSERWGRDGRNRWIAAMANGKTLDEATREVLGMSFDDLDRAWRESLKDDAGK